MAGFSNNNNDRKVTYFAETDSRNRRTPFGIKAEDRSRHMYLIGKTGMGKSTLLENMAVQDIQSGEGLAFIDPHGKTAELLLDYVPKERINDVLYFAPFDLEYPVSFNVMEDVGYEKRHLVANGLMSAFKKIWVDAWSARMEYILNNILLALLEYPDSTLLGVNRMLADKDFRKKVVENVTDPAVKSFWVDEFAKYGERYMQEAGAAIQNKIGQFISNPVIRNIIGQPKSTFDVRRLMDERKIVIINLSKGRVGEANANLLGSMLITKIYLGAMSRADLSPAAIKNMPPFYLYVDEFQSFANESFADILSEARKYKLALTVAHQYIEQMSDEVRAAVFGNVGTMITFRIGSYDAEVLEKEFDPFFTAQDLVSLGQFQLYLKLMIDGVSSQPFSAVSLPPIAKPLVAYKDEIITASRTTFARPRPQVEEEIREWHQPLASSDENKRPRLPKGEDVRGDDRKHSLQGPRRNEEDRTRSFDRRPGPDHRQSSAVPHRSDQHTPSKEALEKQLRQAITLQYEKGAEESRQNEEERKQREEERKRKKIPSQENVGALRNALAAVLKDVPQQTTPTPPTPAPRVVKEDKKSDTITPPPVQKPSEKPQIEAVSGEPKAEKPRAEGIPDTAKPHEVPEDVLKKMLEV